MPNLEITPSPTPCSRYLMSRFYFDCVVCGWNEEAHYLESYVFYRSFEEFDRAQAR